MTHRCLYAVVLTVFAVTSFALAATSNATIWGTVYDSSGKPAANVTVVLDNTSLGIVRTLTTDSQGSYTISEVPPADGYRVTASSSGERWDVRLGVTVNVGDERVIIPPLRQQQTVAVIKTISKIRQASADTISSSVSGVIVGEQLRQLPLFNRNFLALGLLTPGTHDVPAGSPLAGASYSISGTGAGDTTFLLDGVENVATSTNQAIPFQVNDSIQEFRVVSADANAEYGRTLGGVVNIVTRRAGNNLHGSAFGYFASDILNASNPLSLYNGSTFDQAATYAGNPNSYYAGFYPLTYNDYVSSAKLAGACTNSISAVPQSNMQPLCVSGGEFGFSYPAVGRNDLFLPQQLLAQFDRHKQPFTSEQFGINEGGAIVKEKVFLFGSYEGTRIDNPNSIFERVPSQFDKTYNPLMTRGVGEAFHFGASDPNYVLAQRVLSLFPAPNVIAVPDALEFYRGEAPNYTHVHNGLLRADMVLSSRSTVTIRYAIQRLTQLHDDTLPAQVNYAGNGALRDSLNHNIAVIYSKVFSPSTLGESRISFNRFGVGESPQDAGNHPTNLLGLPFAQMPTFLLNGLDAQYGGTIPLTDGASGGWGEGASTSDGLRFTPTGPTLDYKFPFARIGAPLTAPSSTGDNNWLLEQAFTLTRGKHSLRFGIDSRLSRDSYSDGSFSRGLVYSSNIGQFTSNSEGCNQACRFIDEQGQKPIVAFDRPSFDFALKDGTPYLGLFHSYALAGFVQDTWRFRRRLTLNVGLRYDFFSTPRESQSRLWNFDATANRLVQQGSSESVNPYGQTCSPGRQFSTNPDVPLLSSQSLGGTAFTLSQSDCSPSAHGGIDPKSNNFGPRVGFAWDVFGTGHTVVRAGFGYYYQPIPLRSFEQLLYNRPTMQPNAILGSVTSPKNGFCNIPASFGGCALGNSLLDPQVLNSDSLDKNNPNSSYASVTQPFASYGIDTHHASTPTTRQINLSVQQQIGNDLTMDAAYVGARGGDLPAVYNTNFNSEFTYPQGRAPIAYTDMLLFPVFMLTNQARSNYHSLIARGTFKSHGGLILSGSYTFSKSLDNEAGSTFPMVPITANNFNLSFSSFAPNSCIYSRGGCGTAPILVFPTINYALPAVTTTGQAAVQTTPYSIPQDPFNFLHDDYGPSDFDSRHRGVINFTWNLPVEQRWLAKLFRNTEISGIEIIRSGQPFTIFAGPILNEVTQRAEAFGPVHVTDNPAGAISQQNLSLAPCPRYPIELFLFSPNQPCIGNTGRNSFVGPAYLSTDAALQKDFHIPGRSERVLSFRAEAFNLLNSANFYNPISTLSTDGINPNPDFGKIKSSYSPRELQFAARFSW